jgi:predicted Zn-dependent protease
MMKAPGASDAVLVGDDEGFSADSGELYEQGISRQGLQERRNASWIGRRRAWPVPRSAPTLPFINKGITFPPPKSR